MELFKTVPAYWWLFIYFCKYWNLRNIELEKLSRRHLINSSDVFVIKGFTVCICILNTVRGVFNIKSLFSVVVEILCSYAFSTIIRLFFGTFLYKIILEPEKKSQKVKFQNDRTLFLETFYIKDLFSTGLLAPKFRTLFPKLFLENFFGGPSNEVFGKKYLK